MRKSNVFIFFILETGETRREGTKVDEENVERKGETNIKALQSASLAYFFAPFFHISM
jgi:hypothetical protein